MKGLGDIQIPRLIHWKKYQLVLTFAGVESKRLPNMLWSVCLSYLHLAQAAWLHLEQGQTCVSLHPTRSTVHHSLNRQEPRHSMNWNIDTPFCWRTSLQESTAKDCYRKDTETWSAHQEKPHLTKSARAAWSGILVWGNHLRYYLLRSSKLYHHANNATDFHCLLWNENWRVLHLHSSKI